MKFILDFILRLLFIPTVYENNFGTEKLWYRKPFKTASLTISIGGRTGLSSTIMLNVNTWKGIDYF